MAFGTWELFRCLNIWLIFWAYKKPPLATHTKLCCDHLMSFAVQPSGEGRVYSFKLPEAERMNSLFSFCMNFMFNFELKLGIAILKFSLSDGC